MFHLPRLPKLYIRREEPPVQPQAQDPVLTQPEALHIKRREVRIVAGSALIAATLLLIAITVYVYYK